MSEALKVQRHHIAKTAQTSQFQESVSRISLKLLKYGKEESPDLQVQ